MCVSAGGRGFGFGKVILEAVEIAQETGSVPEWGSRWGRERRGPLGVGWGERD